MAIEGRNDGERDVAHVRTEQPHLVVLDHVEWDLGARVPGIDDEHPALLELVWVAKLAEVELEDVVLEARRKGRNRGNLIARHGHHHVVGEHHSLTRVT